MIKVDKVIIVEGKYDKIKLSSILDATIIETNGFEIFKDKEKQKLIRDKEIKKGIIILTDSDSAGFKIRSFIGGSIPNEYITHAYVPDIYGKEKRKAEPSKEGKLGVEGISKDIIIDALTKAGVTCSETKEKSKEITNIDFYEDGISGGKNSKELRTKLLEELELPTRLSTSSLLNIINIFCSYDEYKTAINNVKNNDKFR